MADPFDHPVQVGRLHAPSVEVQDSRDAAHDEPLFAL
jgi:hypothetical protein